MLRGRRTYQACYDDAMRMLRHLNVSRWSGVSQQVVRVVLVEFGERYDKLPNGQ